MSLFSDFFVINLWPSLDEPKPFTFFLGFILAYAVIIIKFFVRDGNPAHFVVLLYDMIKVAAVGLTLNFSMQIYQKSAGDHSSLLKELNGLQTDLSHFSEILSEKNAKIKELESALSSAKSALAEATTVSDPDNRFLTNRLDLANRLADLCTQGRLSASDALSMLNEYSSGICPMQ